MPWPLPKPFPYNFSFKNFNPIQIIFFSPDSHAASKHLSHRAPRPRLALRLQEEATLTDNNPAPLLLHCLQTKRIPSTGNWSFYSWWEQQQQIARWQRLETCCWSSSFLRFVTAQSQRKRSSWGKTVGKVVKARIPRARWMDGWMNGWMIYMRTENNSSLVFLFLNSNQGGVVVR